ARPGRNGTVLRMRRVRRRQPPAVAGAYRINPRRRLSADGLHGQRPRAGAAAPRLGGDFRFFGCPRYNPAGEREASPGNDAARGDRVKPLNPIVVSGREVLPLVEGGKGISISNGESSGAWAASGGVGTFSGVNADSYNE